MKILADENLHALLIEDLRNEGYEVFSIREKHQAEFWMQKLLQLPTKQVRF